MIRAASIVPSLKRYVLEMRFKPMPRYEQGAVVHAEHDRRRPALRSGTLFIQPRVDTRERQNVLLDDVIGPWFAVLCWNNDPRRLLGEEEFARWKALGASFIAVRPLTQLHWTADGERPDPDVVGGRRPHRCAEDVLRRPAPTRCCSCGPTAASPAPASPSVAPELSADLFARARTDGT